MEEYGMLDRLLDWALDNPEAAGAIAYAIYSAVAKIILATTDTPNPDTFKGKFYKVLEFSALIFGKTKDRG